MVKQGLLYDETACIAPKVIPVLTASAYKYYTGRVNK